MLSYSGHLLLLVNSLNTSLVKDNLVSFYSVYVHFADKKNVELFFSYFLKTGCPNEGFLLCP